MLVAMTKLQYREKNLGVREEVPEDAARDSQIKRLSMVVTLAGYQELYSEQSRDLIWFGLAM